MEGSQPILAATGAPEMDESRYNFINTGELRLGSTVQLYLLEGRLILIDFVSLKQLMTTTGISANMARERNIQINNAFLPSLGIEQLLAKKKRKV